MEALRTRGHICNPLIRALPRDGFPPRCTLGPSPSVCLLGYLLSHRPSPTRNRGGLVTPGRDHFKVFPPAAVYRVCVFVYRDTHFLRKVVSFTARSCSYCHIVWRVGDFKPSCLFLVRADLHRVRGAAYGSALWIVSAIPSPQGMLEGTCYRTDPPGEGSRGALTPGRTCSC